MCNKPGKQDMLRNKAEAKLAHGRSGGVPARTAEELLHELQVHQIELEMQNEELRRSQIALEESRDHYIDFYDFAPVGYLTLTGKGLISEINLTGAALLGAERSKLLHQRLVRFVAPEDSDSMHRFLQTVLKHDEKLSCELLFKRGDGSGFQAHLDCLRLVKDGSTPVVRIVLTDITERQQKDEALREQEEFFRMIAENTEDFIAVLDLEGRRLYNNPTYASLFGDIESMKGTNSFAEIHPDDRELVTRVFKETVRSGIGLRTDFRFVLPDGGIRHMESRGGLIRDSRGKATRVVVVSRDITERKAAEEKILNLAFYDALTGLPNRRLLNDRMARVMATSKRSGRYGALMFIDLDNFKPLNDRHGHAAGDLLLVEAARRISGCVREADTVSRFGGDEFVVLLDEMGVKNIKPVAETGSVAEKIRIAMAVPYVLTIKQEGNAEITVTHHCTSSIGVVVFVNHEISADEILKRADLAMYQAKNKGRNSICFFGSDPSVQPGLSAAVK